MYLIKKEIISLTIFFLIIYIIKNILNFSFIYIKISIIIMSHKKCSTKIIHDTMKDFEKHKLKLRNNKVVESKKQAIAIALSQVENKCEYSTKEYKLLEEKVKEFISYEPIDKIPLSRVVETKQIIEYYHMKKNLKKCHKYERGLWYVVIKSVMKGFKMTNNIWNELNDIKKLLNV